MQWKSQSTSFLDWNVRKVGFVDNLDHLDALYKSDDLYSKAVLLPRIGKLHQQTLITTQNQYADKIPAQRMEVTKFDPSNYFMSCRSNSSSNYKVLQRFALSLFFNKFNHAG